MVDLTQQLVAVAVKFLGPEARRFLDRQTSHLEGNITLDTIMPSDLEKFAWWVNVSAKLIMDKEKAKELSQQIATLGAKTETSERVQ